MPIEIAVEFRERIEPGFGASSWVRFGSSNLSSFNQINSFSAKLNSKRINLTVQKRFMRHRYNLCNCYEEK